MLIKNVTKEKLKKGLPAFGFRMEFASPFLVEVLGHAGFDFVYFDCEHGPINEGEVEAMVRAAELAEIIPLVRVPTNEPHYILRALDSGAMGIIIPHCGSKEDAQAAVRAAKYPPEGERGIAGRSWSHCVMSGMSTADYIKEANKETLLIAMIEDEVGVQEISHILTVEGLDGLWIGRADLSVSLEIPGQRDHAMIREAVDTILKEAKGSGKAIGIGWVDFGETEEIKSFIERGAQFFALGASFVLMSTARGMLQKIKEGLNAG
jgi:4-hydroxy-2-oxoheptanedioate aldolase